jgi:hypothetical protein
MIRGALVLCGLALYGCQHIVNVYQDETIPSDAITTPTPPPPHMRPGDWPAVEAVGHGGTVSHWPLWFEDPFEDKGSDDGRFAVTWEDYVAWPYTTGRWLVDFLALPVSIVVTPPFTIMSSDGVLSRQLIGFCHDAEVGPGSATDVGEAESLTVKGATVQNSEESEAEATSE